MYSMRAMAATDLEKIRLFTDREIGCGYYSKEELQKIFERSQKNGIMCTLVLEDDEGQVKGVRISYPAQKWEHGKGKGLEPEKWPHPLEHTAYFQSIFLSSDVQGGGWGGKLSQEALKLLRQSGAKGVVCHSWKESPNDSSGRYLRKLGFELVAEHPEYWKAVPYKCTRCGEGPCLCTAQEMYLDLERTL